MSANLDVIGWESKHINFLSQILDWYTVLAWWQQDCQWGLRHGFQSHHPVVIGWSKYSLWLPGALLYSRLMWPVWIPTVFRLHWQSLCTALATAVRSCFMCVCVLNAWMSCCVRFDSERHSAASVVQGPIQGPVLLLQHDTVTTILTNGSAAFKESCNASSWNDCDNVKSL